MLHDIFVLSHNAVILWRKDIAFYSYRSKLMEIIIASYSYRSGLIGSFLELSFLDRD